MALDGGGENAPRFIAVGLDAAEGVEGKLGIDDHQLFVAQKDDGVGGFAAGKAILQGKLRRRERVFEQPLQGDFAEESAGFGTTENIFYGLRSEREAAALLMDRADLFLKMENLLARVLQLGGNGGLPLRGDVRGAGDTVGEGFGDAFKALRDGLPDGLDLAGALRLRLRDGEEIATELGELRFECGAFLLRLRNLGNEPKD